MATVKNKYRVLVASTGDKLYDYISEILSPDEYELLQKAGTAGEIRRIMLDSHVDIFIINTPLPDEFGVDLAVDAAETTAGVILLVKSEIFDQVCYKAEGSGVLTLSKPSSRQGIYGAVKLATALSARLTLMEKKNQNLQEKMADIRAVNRAKWLLIENKNFTEKEAHYYIEKLSMDSRLSRKEVAENIIHTYDK